MAATSGSEHICTAIDTPFGEYKLLSTFGSSHRIPTALPAVVNLSVVSYRPASASSSLAPNIKSPSMSRMSLAANSAVAKHLSKLLQGNDVEAVESEERADGSGIQQQSEAKDDNNSVSVDSVQLPVPGRVAKVSSECDSAKGLLDSGERQDEGPGYSFVPHVDRYCFVYNSGKQVSLCDLLRPSKAPMSVRSFRINPTCHTVRGSLSAPRTSLMVLVGLQSGAVVLYDGTAHVSSSAGASRFFNAEGALESSAVTCLRWVTDSTFLAAHKSGCIMMYSTNREEEKLPSVHRRSVRKSRRSQSGGNVDHKIRFRKSEKHNPMWKLVVCHSRVNALEVSPNGMYFAAACADGYLKVFNLETGLHNVSFKSFYGAILCVAWSPDSAFLLSGGEDDAVCLWSIEERAILARGEGHESWVTSVAFDGFAEGNPYGSDGTFGLDDCILSFGSVGADCRLNLWSFSFHSIAQPQNATGADLSPSGDLWNGVADDTGEEEADNRAQMPQTSLVVYTPTEVPSIEPIASGVIHNEPMCDIHFLPFGVMTTCSGGETKVWARPGMPDTVEFDLSGNKPDKDAEDAMAASLASKPRFTDSPVSSFGMPSFGRRASSSPMLGNVNGNGNSPGTPQSPVTPKSPLARVKQLTPIPDLSLSRGKSTGTAKDSDVESTVSNEQSIVSVEYAAMPDDRTIELSECPSPDLNALDSMEPRLNSPDRTVATSTSPATSSTVPVAVEPQTEY